MKEKGQLEKLSKNYDELEEDKKETLLKIGEKLLSIQELTKGEVDKKESKDKSWFVKFDFVIQVWVFKLLNNFFNGVFYEK